MIRFKRYLNEYRKVPMPDEFSAFSLKTYMDDEENLTQLKVSSTVLNKIFVTFEYNIDANHKVFIIVDRLDHSHIAGYMFIQKIKKYWQSLGAAVFDPYKNKGLGTDLYLNIINCGYQLINGTELSSSSEKVWLKLKDLTIIKVVNLKTCEIENWSDKPTHDTKEGEQQEWFWITELKSINEQFSGNLKRDTDFKNWLKGVATVPGFSCTRYCIDNEY